jgi:DNA-directed RNA polymerase specialized sigma24 family protein
MTGPGSITLLAEQLRSGDPAAREEAARQIWQRHFPGLLALACRHLDGRLKVRQDEEDVLQSMYASFCLRQQRGDFALGGREDLWQLLVTMTLNKTRNAAARHRSQRRDYRREQGAAGGEGPMTPDEALAALEGAGPTPDEAVELTEQLHARLRGLPEALRQIALWKLEGYTHEEIAAPERLGCTVRTVERKLQLIREHWQAEA